MEEAAKWPRDCRAGAQPSNSRGLASHSLARRHCRPGGRRRQSHARCDGGCALQPSAARPAGPHRGVHPWPRLAQKAKSGLVLSLHPHEFPKQEGGGHAVRKKRRTQSSACFCLHETQSSSADWQRQKARRWAARAGVWPHRSLFCDGPRSCDVCDVCAFVDVTLQHRAAAPNKRGGGHPVLSPARALGCSGWCLTCLQWPHRVSMRQCFQ